MYALTGTWRPSLSWFGQRLTGATAHAPLLLFPENSEVTASILFGRSWSSSSRSPDPLDLDSDCHDLFGPLIPRDLDCGSACHGVCLASVAALGAAPGPLTLEVWTRFGFRRRCYWVIRCGFGGVLTLPLRFSVRCFAFSGSDHCC